MYGAHVLLGRCVRNFCAFRGFVFGCDIHNFCCGWDHKVPFEAFVWVCVSVCLQRNCCSGFARAHADGFFFFLLCGGEEGGEDGVFFLVHGVSGRDGCILPDMGGKEMALAPVSFLNDLLL